MRARDNPFTADRVLTVRYKPQGFTWDELLDRLESLNFRAAIVGPHGTGKTTLLEDLSPRLRSRGMEPIFLRLDASEPRLNLDQWRQVDRARSGDILLLDGAEQLPTMHWLHLRYRARQADGLLITTHRPGRLPTLVHTKTSAELLAEILNDLGVGAGDSPSLVHRHRGNLRDCLRELYEQHSSQSA